MITNQFNDLTWLLHPGHICYRSEDSAHLILNQIQVTLEPKHILAKYLFTYFTSEYHFC